MPRGGRRHVGMVSFVNLNENFKCFGATQEMVNCPFLVFTQLFLRK